MCELYFTLENENDYQIEGAPLIENDYHPLIENSFLNENGYQLKLSIRWNQVLFKSFYYVLLCSN